MSLRDFQLAVAALACEPGESMRYQKDKSAWASERGLGAADAARLATIPAAQLLHFHELQARDRASTLRALFPDALALAAHDAIPRFLAAFPYGDDDFVAEAKRFASWARTALGDEAAEAAAFESAWWSLLHAPLRSTRVVPAGAGALVLLRGDDGIRSTRVDGPEAAALLALAGGATRAELLAAHADAGARVLAEIEAKGMLL